MKRVGTVTTIVVFVIAAFVIGRQTTPDLAPTATLPPPTAEAPSGEVASYRVQGLDVIDPVEVMAAADAAFAGQSVVWRSEEARCFFSQPSAGAELHSFLRCGPVYRTLQHGAEPWDTWALAGARHDNGFALTIGPRIEIGSALDVGEVLSRPDGLEPSDDQPTFPNATPTEDPTIRYPTEDWQTAEDIERCLAASGVRAFAVEAIAENVNRISTVTLTTVSFDGIEEHGFTIRRDRVESSLDPDDPLELVATDCVRRAADDYRYRD